MKLLLFLAFINLKLYSALEKSNLESNSENTITNTNYALIKKKCLLLNAEKKKLCEEMIMKNELLSQSRTKVKFKVEAILYPNENNNTNHANEIFHWKMPINTCKNEDCEFCCLRTNRCGTQEQCENSKYYITYVNYTFLGLIVILTLCLIIKCFQVDSYPDQQREDKIDNNDLKELINMFSIIRNNRKKLIS
jgi:hypothetical protein